MTLAPARDVSKESGFSDSSLKGGKGKGNTKKGKGKGKSSKGDRKGKKGGSESDVNAVKGALPAHPLPHEIPASAARRGSRRGRGMGLEPTLAH